MKFVSRGRAHLAKANAYQPIAKPDSSKNGKGSLQAKPLFKYLLDGIEV